MDRHLTIVVKIATTVVFGALAACGGGGSTPAGPSRPPAPTTYTITGTLTATNGGQPLAGATIAGAGVSVTSSASGSYALTLPVTMTEAFGVTMEGAGLIPRRAYVNGGRSRTVDLDAIIDGNGFDLAFYRQLVRGAYDTPDTLQPLRRWTRAPQIYLRTVDDAGASIDAKTLDSTESAIRETLPIWSGGTFSVGVLERGAETRIGQREWITVVWMSDRSPGPCGRADVALPGGTIALFYRRGGICRCVGGPEIRPRTVRHELGHAMGFLHTGSTNDLMAGIGAAGCDAMPSARERYHAAIAYKRPVGNTDPDSDPVASVNLAPLRVP
jgi:hypothetical protein